MMSSGGLTAASLFQGKDAVLSGPPVAWSVRCMSGARQVSTA